MMSFSPSGVQNKRRRSNSDGELANQTLSKKISKISNEFNLALDDYEISQVYPLPSTPESKCKSYIRFLHYRDPDGLRDCLAKFRSANTGPERRNASELASALRIQSSSVSNRAITPSANHPGRSPKYGDEVAPPEYELELGSDALMLISATPTSSLTLPDRSRSFPSTASSTPLTTSAHTSFTSVSLAYDDPFISRPGQNLEDAGEPQRLLPKTLEHYLIKELPQSGLFVKPLPAPLQDAPEHVSYECVRLAQSYNLDIHQIADLYVDHAADWADYDVFWSRVRKLMPLGANPTKVAKIAWTAAATTNSEAPYLQRTIRFRFAKKSDRALFHLSLDPIQKLPETCRLFRHFGSHRFLKLEIPPTKDLPEYLKGQDSNLRSRLQEWLVGPAKEFLGCRWKVFFVRPAKAEKKSKNKKESKQIEFEAFLFAESGASLSDITVEEMLEWFMPLKRNMNLSLHKAVSRIELGLSKTLLAFVFKPSQVRWVPDIYADGTLSNDPWDPKHDPSDPCVMNDGCARMSIAAARKIWAAMKEPGPCPSAFQARFGPAKGMWMIDVSQGYENPDIWIEVNQSQRKFLPHEADLDDDTYNPDRLTFEVLEWTSKASQSKLYRDYLPILEDRGVPRSVLSNFVIQMLEKEAEIFFEAFKSDDTLYKWIEEKFGAANQYSYDSNDQYLDGLPIRIGPRVLKLLDSGFEKEFEYVSNIVKTLVKSYFKRLCVELDVLLPNSTFVYGLADPVHCLKPNEIHLAFSGQFGDQPYPFLAGVEVLVARHPAMRSSDMQRVKVVYKEELAHLRDVVVFPTQGCFPLAGKLQGGDYDGDRFWVCFEKSIVDSFKNAAQPCSDTPESLGIQVDRTKLGEVDETNGHVWESIVCKGIKSKLQSQLLGIVSNFHRKLTYYQNSIATKAAERVVNLHDFLVDSSKNGYSFDNSAWHAFRQTLGVDLRAVDTESPAFDEVSQSALFDRMPLLRTRHVIDDMIFSVARSHTTRIMDKIDSLHTYHADSDEKLSQIYMEERASSDSAVIKTLEELRCGLRNLYENRQRRRAHDKDGMTPEESVEILRQATDKANNSYKALRPNELPASWLNKSTPYEPCHWDLVKASAIFTLHGECMEFVFDCAGLDLCHIMAYTKERPALMVSARRSQLKMRRMRRMATDITTLAAVQPKGCDKAMAFGAGLDGSCDTEEDEYTDNVFEGCSEAELQAMERNVFESPSKRKSDGEESVLQPMADNTLGSPKKRRL